MLGCTPSANLLTYENISCDIFNATLLARRAVTNVVRTCDPSHLFKFDFMSNKICLNQLMKKFYYSVIRRYFITPNYSEKARYVFRDVPRVY